MNKQKAKKKRRMRRDNFSVMCRAIGRYLEKHGWSVLLIGDAQIRSWDADGYKHEFAMTFTGKKSTLLEEKSFVT